MLLGNGARDRIGKICQPRQAGCLLHLVLGCKTSRYLKSPFPQDHTIVRLARKRFVRRVNESEPRTPVSGHGLQPTQGDETDGFVRDRSRDCPPIIYREFMQPSTTPSAAPPPDTNPGDDNHERNAHNRAKKQTAHVRPGQVQGSVVGIPWSNGNQILV